MINKLKQGKSEHIFQSPANRFEHLKGDLKNYCSIRINYQYRIVFKFQDGYAEDVYIADYH